MQKLFFSREIDFFTFHRVYAKFHQVMMLGITGREHRQTFFVIMQDKHFNFFLDDMLIVE